MIEKIFNIEDLLAIIIRKNYTAEGIKFFTPDNFSQQLGYMNRKRGYIIPPHTHNKINKQVTSTKEVLIIKSGKVRVDFYDDNKIYLESKILNVGDVILLAKGGHGFEMLEQSEMIEIKQGPYNNDDDKTRFKSIIKKKIQIK